MPWHHSGYSRLAETCLGALVALLVVWGICGAPLP